MNRNLAQTDSQVDLAATLQSETGTTPEGMPLAFNRSADPRIRDWVGRSMVSVANEVVPATLHGLLCNDASYLRTAVDADWVAGTADGPLPIRNKTFLCGQHSQSMPLQYTGGIRVAGLMLRPGALRALFGLNESQMVDRIRFIEAVGISDQDVTGLHSYDLGPDKWIEAIENWLAEYVVSHDIQPPDSLAQALELQAFADPACVLRDFAEQHGVSPRTVERVAKRDFGLTPSQIMRRARILDSAARLCGVADDEEVDILLRYFDQAHQIREFKTFFGMTPRQFTQKRSGLLTLSLEIRQSRRLELLERLKPGAVKPWMRQPFQSPSS